MAIGNNDGNRARSDGGKNWLMDGCSARGRGIFLVRREEAINATSAPAIDGCPTTRCYGPGLCFLAIKSSNFSRENSSFPRHCWALGSALSCCRNTNATMISPVALVGHQSVHTTSKHPSNTNLRSRWHSVVYIRLEAVDCPLAWALISHLPALSRRIGSSA
jgi:hypothetical protein